MPFVSIKDFSLLQSPFLQKGPKKNHNPNPAAYLWGGEKYY